MTDNYKAWKDMFTTSQKMMNDWVETFTNPIGNKENKEEDKKEFDFTNYKDVMSFQQKMFEDWQKMFGFMNPQNYAKQNPELKLINTDVAKEEYAIAVGKNDKELVEDIDKALTELKANGTYDKLIKKYFSEK